MIVIASGKIRSPSLSFRKLVPRAIDGPEIAPSRCEIKPRATRGSNTTGQRQVGIFFAPSRLTARSPALLPISAGSRRSAA